jgi:hypothetical protein
MAKKPMQFAAARSGVPERQGGKVRGEKVTVSVKIKKGKKGGK